ncbi:MAG: sigma-54-dependent Fis family transcriptional regulator [Planctomycetes bacterium]|nr:sigma-54-dependent Fis family transcriptional regulator [Planctomycetota bacterium]
MRADDLNLKELLEFDPAGGIVRFAGRRAVILDAVAHGLLRKELIDTFGVNVARGILTRFGYVHGKRMADAMRSEFKWDNDEEWRRAGPRIYCLQGLVVPDAESPGVHLGKGVTWKVSYEAEQHLLHLGRAEYPVCWTLCGLASGYLSSSMGKEVYTVEDRCLGRGDPACHVLARTREDWGKDMAEHLPFFQNKGIDASLKHVAEVLKRTERQLQERARRLARVAGLKEDPSGIMARSESMQRVVEQAKRMAGVDSTVMISGESGAGKERIARLLHDQSTRSEGPFIALNCGAVSETLLESELFGHARGAFTGAAQDRAGLFEAANGGTLFLDEVGDIPLSMQVKLLRAFQEREIRRVGENRSRPINVRIVTATNRDLSVEVAAKRFRKDLYYRLKVVELSVPPLRERREDILPLARIFLAEAALRMKRHVETLSPAAADQLLRYDWPGNVRELENAMERAVALARKSRVELDELPPEIRRAVPIPAVHGPPRPLKEVEKNHILATLDSHGGNRAKTAETLEIGIATLHRKLKSFAKS